MGTQRASERDATADGWMVCLSESEKKPLCERLACSRARETERKEEEEERETERHIIYLVNEQYYRWAVVQASLLAVSVLKKAWPAKALFPICMR